MKAVILIGALMVSGCGMAEQFGQSAAEAGREVFLTDRQRAEKAVDPGTLAEACAAQYPNPEYAAVCVEVGTEALVAAARYCK